MHSHQHCGYLAGGGFEQYRVGINGKHFAVENSISGLRILDDAIFRAGDEFANDSLRETLLDAISSRIIGKCGNSDGLPFRGQLGGAAGNVVAAARRGQHREETHQRDQVATGSAMTVATAILQSVPPQFERRSPPEDAGCRQLPRAIRRSLHSDRIRYARDEFRFHRPR